MKIYGYQSTTSMERIEQAQRYHRQWQLQTDHLNTWALSVSNQRHFNLLDLKGARPRHRVTPPNYRQSINLTSLAFSTRTGISLAIWTDFFFVNNYSKPQVKNFVWSGFGNSLDYKLVTRDCRLGQHCTELLLHCNRAYRNFLLIFRRFFWIVLLIRFHRLNYIISTEITYQVLS